MHWPLLLLAAEVLMAGDDPYAPNVPIDEATQGASPPTHQVYCNDPKTMYDCHQQAHQLCNGEFVMVKEEEDDKGKKGGKGGGQHKTRALQLSTGASPGAPAPTLGKGTKRSMTFTCKVKPK